MVKVHLRSMLPFSVSLTRSPACVTLVLRTAT